MLAHILPRRELLREPLILVQHDPVHDGDERGEGDDGAVVERVERLEGSRQAGEEWSTGEGVGECVGCGDEEVEGEAPVG